MKELDSSTHLPYKEMIWTEASHSDVTGISFFVNEKDFAVMCRKLSLSPILLNFTDVFESQNNLKWRYTSLHRYVSSMIIFNNFLHCVILGCEVIPDSYPVFCEELTEIVYNCNAERELVIWPLIILYSKLRKKGISYLCNGISCSIVDLVDVWAMIKSEKNFSFLSSLLCYSEYSMRESRFGDPEEIRFWLRHFSSFIDMQSKFAGDCLGSIKLIFERSGWTEFIVDVIYALKHSSSSRSYLRPLTTCMSNPSFVLHGTGKEIKDLATGIALILCDKDTVSRILDF
jgi:hypothetical protein